MKTLNRKFEAGTATVRNGGMALLDVLLAIVIFVIGLLALLHLQTNLTRSSSDASARTVAMNIGEELIERLRAFERVSVDPDGVKFAFADIDPDYIEALGTDTRGGLDFTTTATVWGYYYNDDGTDIETAIAVADGDTTVYDFKEIELTIVWNEDLGFEIDDTTTISPGDMNTGQVTLSGVISSIPPFSSARLAADEDLGGNVPVNYTPGYRPDIVRLGIEGTKFKESTTPKPKVIKGGGSESTQTWFDVITYNQSAGAAEGVFLRREEFLVVSCECTLRQSSGSGGGGLLPTIWNGQEYVTGPTHDGSNFIERKEFVSKMYGESNSNTPGVDYCVTCCRDHHDDTGSYGSADEVYDPARVKGMNPLFTEGDASSGDHIHYSRAGGDDGGLTPAGVNDTYVEACRMVRKDGFMRVAQDFRQEGFVGFPEGYLETLSGAQTYADYVLAAVSDHYENDRDTLTEPDGATHPPGSSPWADGTYDFPGTETNPTSLPFPGVGGLDNQQMRSRGVYVDHLGTEALQKINCLYANDGSATISETCATPGITSYLEALPFFEVQTTWLSWWNEEPVGIPVDVSNEGYSIDNKTGELKYSRGKAELLEFTIPDLVTVTTDMHRGNSGLSITDPISPLDESALARNAHDLTVSVNGGLTATPPSSTYYFWTGTLKSAVNGVDASDAAVVPGNENTYCSRSGVSISCLTPIGATGSVTISGYYKNAGTPLWICAVNDIPGRPSNSDPNGLNKSSTLTWNLTGNVSGVALSISNQACALPTP